MTSIGRRCTRREALSRAVLIARGLGAQPRTRPIFFSCFRMIIDLKYNQPPIKALLAAMGRVVTSSHPEQRS